MKHRFQHVAVLMGGPSSEREVSLRSGGAIASALRALGYDAVDVDVTTTDVHLPSNTDAAFIALHGTFGEDGDVQEILERKKIPYTGAGVRSSRLAFDKIASKRIFEAQAIPTPRYEIIRAGQRRTLPLPVVVKPPREGSSVGVTVVRDEKKLAGRLGKSLCDEAGGAGRGLRRRPRADHGHRGRPGPADHRNPAAQRFVRLQIQVYKGRNRLPGARTRGRGGSPPVPGDLLARFESLECRGMGRVDIRLTPENEPFVLELNTIPGFTETSLLPKAARCAGMEFPELCERILNLAALDG